MSTLEIFDLATTPARSRYEGLQGTDSVSAQSESFHQLWSNIVHASADVIDGSMSGGASKLSCDLPGNATTAYAYGRGQSKQTRADIHAVAAQVRIRTLCVFCVLASVSFALAVYLEHASNTWLRFHLNNHIDVWSGDHLNTIIVFSNLIARL